MAQQQGITESQRRVVASDTSVAKILNSLVAVPANRSCADCRSPLLDASQVYASFSPVRTRRGGSIFHHHEQYYHRSRTDYGNFRANHQAFAPPGQQHPTATSREEEVVDPAVIAIEIVGGHGVFLCAMCGAAHKILGTKVAIVHSIHDSAAWSKDDVQLLVERGGNERSCQVLEAYMPESWQRANRPNHKSSLAEREIFCRAKYQALAFVLPPTGPKAGRVWFSIVQKHQDLQRWARGELGSMYKLTLPEMRSGNASTESNEKVFVLPTRLVDFFCVVGSTKLLERQEPKLDLSTVSSPEQLCLETRVLDCFPDQDFYDDTQFPEHLCSIVMPNGCQPRRIQAPTFNTFVLTESNGSCLYGATLQIYDESLELDQLKDIILNSGYDGALPTWLTDPATLPPAQQPPELVYIPKCLVVLSHYPFFDVWRKFLLKLYRITLVEAPLPIERYVANFVGEVPLPPQGMVEVRCGFTNDDNWIISRPAPNQLPLVNFSYKPLFASLSVGNIMVVMALLMQESQIALVSQQYALLGVVAESLLSLLFPFQWVGLYAPCLPTRAMIHILDAPLPFLVGVHASYLTSTKPKQRPRGVVFVDLDRDVVHLGFLPETQTPRGVPQLPERDAAKLKSKLDEFGSTVYLVPDSGWKGYITTGTGTLLDNSKREIYAQMSLLDLSASRCRRKDILGKLDRAFPENDELTEMGEFLSECGHLKERGETQLSDSGGGKVTTMRFFRRLRVSQTNTQEPSKSESESKSLLDLDEQGVSSSDEVRKSFLRFFVTIFRNYASFLQPGAKFDSEGFLSDLSLSVGSGQFIRSMLQTQMFQRFLEDRRASPNIDYIRFFDESIVAKNNRSKRNTIATGGKKVTPFLDDVSAKVTDTFTPPPPSNWGLPDDGKGYTYTHFPSLNKDRFGKVRQPKHFPQRQSSLSRMPLPASAGRNRILSGIPSFTPANYTAPERLSKRHVTDLESAMKTLAKVHERRPVNVVEGVGQAGYIKKSSWGSESSESVLCPTVIDLAEDFVLCSRRKQGVLLSFVVELQSFCRMAKKRIQYHRFRNAIIVVQRKFRDEPKLHKAKLQLLLKLQSAVLLQKNLRAIVVRQRFKEKCEAVRNVQRWLRGATKQILFRRLRRAVVCIQAHVRGRRVRYAIYLLTELQTSAQACIRGFLTRKRFQFVMRARMERYRSQIFVLWQHAHTPLSYRTTFWPFFSDSNCLNMNFVEEELYRLWDVLQLSFSPQAMEREQISTKVLVAGEKLGLQLQTWQKFLVVESMLSRQSQMSKGSSFPAASKAAIASASAREQAERLQLYESLRRCGDQALLKDSYAKFNIPAKQKLKKKSLSIAVFTTLDHAEQSVVVMKRFFPELEGSANISWIPPSKKGFKRLGCMIANFMPLDKSTWVQKRIDGRIRSDLKQMTASLLSGRVFRLLVKLDASQQRRLLVHERQQQALMESRNCESWPLCRRRFIQNLLTPLLQRESDQHFAKKSRKNKKQENAVVSLNTDTATKVEKSIEAIARTDIFASIEVVLGPESSKPIFPDEAYASIESVKGNFPAEVYNLLSD